MKRCLPLLVAIGLAGCSASPAGDRLFPLEAGRHWDYRVTRTTDDETINERTQLAFDNRGRDNFNNEAAWRRRSGDGNEYWLRADDSGIYRVAAKSAIDAAARPDGERRYVLRQPLAVGTSWSAPTLPYVLERRNEVPRALRHFVRPVPMEYRIDALDQSVEVPAGRLEHCVRVAGRAEIRLFDDAQRDWRMAPITTLEWYCEGIGLARLERDEPSTTKHVIGGRIVMELLSWR